METIRNKMGVIISNRSFDVDFSRLKNDGFSYALINHNVGRYKNPNLEYHYKNAYDNGFKVSLYHESNGMNPHDIKRECTRIIEKINEYQVDFPVGITLTDLSAEYVRRNFDTDFGIENAALNYRINLMTDFLPFINSDVMFRLRRDEITKEVYKIVSENLPLWYYRNTKTYDKTKCVIWEKRTSDKIPGVQGTAGIFYKI